MNSWKLSAVGLAGIIVAAFIGIGLQRVILGSHSSQPLAAVASATPTATRPAAGRSEPPAVTATPKPANPPVTTGDATVDAVIAMVASNQPGGMQALLQTTSVPCSDAYAIAPVCQGQAAGTPVASVWSFQCEARWVPQNLVSSSHASWLIGRYQLYAVMQGGPAAGRSPEIPADRWLLFTVIDPGLPSGLAVAVANEKVVAYGYSCSDAATFMLPYLAKATGFLVPPTGTLPSGTLVRVKQGTGCLNIRESASMSANVFDCLAEGTLLSDIGDPTVAADGVTWVHVALASGQQGWVSSEYLEPAKPGSS